MDDLRLTRPRTPPTSGAPIEDLRLSRARKFYVLVAALAAWLVALWLGADAKVAGTAIISIAGALTWRIPNESGAERGR